MGPEAELRSHANIQGCETDVYIRCKEQGLLKSAYFRFFFMNTLCNIQVVGNKQ